MLKLTPKQFHRSALNNRRAMVADVWQHLSLNHPDVVKAYPPRYLEWVLNDTLELASPFKLDDAFSTRLFVTLRWLIAPGYFEQQQIAAVLQQTARPAAVRFEELATASYADAWEDARQYDGPTYWRSAFWYEEADAGPAR